MNAFEVYKDYLSLKNHFTKPGYDYVKYNGKVPAKRETFEKRKDKLFFEKVAKYPDPHGFLLANLSVNEKAWIRDLAYSEQAKEIYASWTKKQQSLSYVFTQDIKKLDDDFDSNLRCANGSHPNLLRLYLAKEISLETLCVVLDMIPSARKHWDDQMEYDPVWSEMGMRVTKYTPFVRYDKDKLRQICVKRFS